MQRNIINGAVFWLPHFLPKGGNDMNETVLKNLREQTDIGVRFALMTYSELINIENVTCKKKDIPDITALIKRAGFGLVTSSIFDHEHVSFYSSIRVDEDDETAYDTLAEEQLGIFRTDVS